MYRDAALGARAREGADVPGDHASTSTSSAACKKETGLRSSFTLALQTLADMQRFLLMRHLHKEPALTGGRLPVDGRAAEQTAGAAELEFAASALTADAEQTAADLKE